MFVAVGLCFCAEDASAARFGRGRAIARAARFARNVAFRGVRRSNALFVPFGANYVQQQVVVAQPQVVLQPAIVQQTAYVQPQVLLAQDVSGCSSGIDAAFVNRGFNGRSFRGRR